MSGMLFPGQQEQVLQDFVESLQSLLASIQWIGAHLEELPPQLPPLQPVAQQLPHSSTQSSFCF